jgi:transcriptional regulator with XRE-family HTH domain
LSTEKREISDNIFMTISGEKIVFRIDEILEGRDLTRADACRFAKINLRAMTDWAKKGTIPAADTLYLIANYLETTVEYLVTGVKGKQEEYSFEEKKLIIKFRTLDKQGQYEVKTLLDAKTTPVEAQKTETA